MKFDLSSLNLKAILSNPTGKTLTAAAAGVVAASVDNAISNPTGGALDWAHAHPLAFWLGAQLAHNLISRYAPPPAQNSGIVAPFQGGSPVP